MRKGWLDSRTKVGGLISVSRSAYTLLSEQCLRLLFQLGDFVPSDSYNTIVRVDYHNCHTFISLQRQQTTRVVRLGGASFDLYLCRAPHEKGVIH
eukprot:scaffold2657_cov89-Amphora_coffeaeformis.AAC.35